jgi:hypothetical protein
MVTKDHVAIVFPALAGRRGSNCSKVNKDQDVQICEWSDSEKVKMSSHHSIESDVHRSRCGGGLGASAEHMCTSGALSLVASVEMMYNGDTHCFRFFDMQDNCYIANKAVVASHHQRLRS